MDETTTQLIGLYAGLILMNTLISLVIWWTARGQLQRDLVFMWAGMLLSLVFQGTIGVFFPGNTLLVVLGFSTLTVSNLAQARLITRLVDLPAPYRSTLALLAGSLVLALVMHNTGAPFLLVSLPVAIAVAYAPLVSAVKALWLRWGVLGVSGRTLMLACIANGLHDLDFPVLGNRPEYAMVGFTLAIVIVFAISIYAPVVILERVAKTQARLSAEMEIAQRIQMKVLPRDPKLPGLEITGYMKPADEVGGDYYDVYNLGQHSWILLGDVTGHGLSSGLIMLMAQSILASILHTRNEISPSQLNFLANRILYQNLKRLEELHTMTVVALCRVGSEQRFVYSGNHDHMYIYRARTGDVESVLVTQLPHDLGLLNETPMSEYEESSFVLEEGDLVFISSDGVTEAPRDGLYANGMFDRERVIELLKSAGHLPLSDIKARLLEDLERFTGGNYYDDVTFVLARAVPEPGAVAANVAA